MISPFHFPQIPFAGWQRPYSIDLDLLPAGHVYEVRVKAVDHNMDTAFVSGSVSAIQPIKNAKSFA